ncbi:MAG TPA: septal ring lytic transglycosylase RlpA family protein [Xanthobacteraceae bacterium]|nr:septal ring lytic transglycosylase RlpA family protein [Xanthobacteraceae bacterium]HZO45133.1 septal ring lytic transglycosylase RlpA family protein [Xanthobacteraceae bacterium]
MYVLRLEPLPLVVVQRMRGTGKGVRGSKIRQYRCPIFLALKQQTARPGQGLAATAVCCAADNNKERALKQKKQQFVVAFLLGAVLSAGGIAISQADNPRSESGIASVYSTESGSGTASGQKLDPGALTAAHRTLPFGTKVRVTNKKNGHSVVVTINDRGPFVSGRVIDVTPAGARALGFSGLTQVTLNVGE